RGLDVLGNRYTAMIAGLGSSLTIKQVADFDAQMRRMGTDAQLTTEQVKTLHDKIRDVSNQKDIRIDASALGQGASELLGKTGDYQYVVDNLRNMGLMMQAFGVDGQVAAGLMAQFWEKNVRGADAVNNMMDRLYSQFAVGSVSVADVARAAPKLFSIIQDQGPEAIAQMGAFAQVFAKNKGSIDETVTSIQAMYASLSDKKNIEFLKKNGIDVFVKGTKDIKKPYELMMEILKRAKYDPLKLQDVFDLTGMQGIKALLNPENRQLMEQMIYGTIDLGSTQKAAQTNAEGFNAAMQSLNNEWQRFAEGQLAKPVQELADALNSVDQNTVQNWLQVGKYMAIALGGIIAIRKTYQFGKTIHDIMNPKEKGKGIPGGITDVFGSGVMPVYVVNMGSGGMKGNTGGLPDAPDSSRNPRNSRNPQGPGNRGGKAGKGAGIIAAGLEFYDFLTTQHALPGEVDTLTKSVAGATDASPWEREFAQQSQDNQKALESVWRKVTDWFNSLGDKNIADPRPWAGMQPTQNYPFLPQQLQGEIRVVVEGDARVKSVRVDQPGVRLSAQAGVTSVEQG
ncbi:TPA: phage tail protein, partial [Escherichia coli]